MQWLASTGIVAYPTNMLSRFYGAPGVGALVQLMLTDERYNFRNEIIDFSQPLRFESENGKTTGALAPNEFWYFWRRFLPFGELDWLPDEDLRERVDRRTLVGELSTLTRIFDKPFAMKGMILNYNIPFLDSIFDKVLFVRIKRDPVANVASVLQARQRQFGSAETWYSFKIPEYPQLRELDPVSQCAGQVSYINRALDRGMATVDQSRKLEIEYEQFCRDPRAVYLSLVDRLGLTEMASEYGGPRSFTATETKTGHATDSVREALERYQD